jgi:NAD(P)-dependent dehydrogenase (short-subunit alcohol dehydrogenase family)
VNSSLSRAALSFDDGCVIVAGGSGGIGAGIARRFGAAGVPVIVTYHRNLEQATSVKANIESAGGRCAIHRADLGQAEDIDALFYAAAASGRIAHVIYAAGPSIDFEFIGAIAESEWRWVIDNDLHAAFNLIQKSVQHFRKQGGGNLLAVITSAVERVPLKDVMSAAPKAAIEMLVRGVAKESGRYGIRANCVGPGWINAGLGKKGIEEKLDTAARQATLRQIPLQRFGEADDIAWAALFLCSQQAGFITGQSLAVDGGLQL